MRALKNGVVTVGHVGKLSDEMVSVLNGSRESDYAMLKNTEHSTTRFVDIG